MRSLLLARRNRLRREALDGVIAELRVRVGETHDFIEKGKCGSATSLEWNRGKAYAWRDAIRLLEARK